MGLSQTTLIGEKRHSGMQTMGDTREPMAADCWKDAQDLAEKYAKEFKRDFWILYGAKPHVKNPNTIVAGWVVSIKRPEAGIVGTLVFKWIEEDQRLVVDEDLCLPNDVPISEFEMSTSKKDMVPSLVRAAKKSGAIWLA